MAEASKNQSADDSEHGSSSSAGGASYFLFAAAARNDIVEAKSMLGRMKKKKGRVFGQSSQAASKLAHPDGYIDPDGWTALVYASFMGYEKIVRLLIDEGAELNHRTKDKQMTSLMYASMHGNLEVVQTLVDAGADLELVNYHNVNALQLASRHNHIAIQQVLLKAGVITAGSTAGGKKLLKWLKTIPGVDNNTLIAYPPNIEELRAAKQSYDEKLAEENENEGKLR